MKYALVIVDDEDVVREALAWLLLSVGSGLVHAQAQTWRASSGSKDIHT